MMGGEVLGEVSATASARDEQHVVGDGQQPRKSDLGRGRVVAGGDVGDDGIGADRIVDVFPRAQRSERNERDPSGGALVENRSRSLTCQVERVLYANDVGDLEGTQQVLMGDIADSDSGDQSFVARCDQGTELVDKPLVDGGAVQKAEVNGGELSDTE